MNEIIDIKNKEKNRVWSDKTERKLTRDQSTAKRIVNVLPLLIGVSLVEIVFCFHFVGFRLFNFGSRFVRLNYWIVHNSKAE